MWQEQVETRDGLLAMTWNSWQLMPGTEIIPGTRGCDMLSQWVEKVPMAGEYTICMETSQNGAKTITVPMTQR